MVEDKYQKKKSTSPIELLSREQLKGRKKGCGIRVREMENESLFVHGISYCVNNRLFKSNDYNEGWV